MAVKITIEPAGAGTASYSSYLVQMTPDPESPCDKTGSNPWDVIDCHREIGGCWWASRGEIRGVEVNATANNGYRVYSIQIKVNYSYSNYRGESGQGTETDSYYADWCAVQATHRFDRVGNFNIRTGGDYGGIGGYSSKIYTASSGDTDKEECSSLYHGEDNAESELAEIIVRFEKEQRAVYVEKSPSCANAHVEVNGEQSVTADIGQTVEISTEPCCCPWKFKYWKSNTGETRTEKRFSLKIACEESRYSWTAYYEHPSETELPFVEDGKVVCDNYGYVVIDRRKYVLDTQIKDVDQHMTRQSIIIPLTSIPAIKSEPRIEHKNQDSGNSTEISIGRGASRAGQNESSEIPFRILVEPTEEH